MGYEYVYVNVSVTGVRFIVWRIWYRVIVTTDYTLCEPNNRFNTYRQWKLVRSYSNTNLLFDSHIVVWLIKNFHSSSTWIHCLFFLFFLIPLSLTLVWRFFFNSWLTSPWTRHPDPSQGALLADPQGSISSKLIIYCIYVIRRIWPVCHKTKGGDVVFPILKVFVFLQLFWKKFIRMLCVITECSVECHEVNRWRVWVEDTYTTIKKEHIWHVSNGCIYFTILNHYVTIVLLNRL